YRYLPDLSIAQVMFAVGLTAAVLGGLGLSAANGPRLRWLTALVTAVGLGAAGTAVTLAGTGRLDPHGMIVIPALHDAASGQPGMTSAEFASQLAQNLALQLVSDVILSGGDRAAELNPSPAQLAVIGGSVRFPPSVEERDLAPLFGHLLPVPGSPAARAARR